MNHGKEIVGPVFITWAQVAVAYRRKLGKLSADLLSFFLGNRPDAHSIGTKPRFTVVENGGKAAHYTALFELGCNFKEFFVCNPQYFSDVRKGLCNDINIFLQSLDDLNMFRCKVYLLVGSLVYFLFFGTFAGSIHLYFDFEHLQCGQNNGIFGTTAFLENVNGLFKSQCCVGCYSHGEPDVVVVVSQVVVAYTRVHVDNFCCVLYLLFRNFECHKGRFVSQAFGIENSGGLAYDPLFFELAYGIHYCLFTAAQCIGKLPEWSLG